MKRALVSVTVLMTSLSVDCLAEGLCPSEMSTLFFCTTEKTKKLVSICQDGDRVQYRYETSDNVELNLPEKASKNQIFVSKFSFPTGEELGVGFRRGDYTYTILNYFGGKPPTEFDHVIVISGTREVADIRCSMNMPTKGSLRELAAKLEEQGYGVVER